MISDSGGTNDQEKPSNEAVSVVDPNKRVAVSPHSVKSRGSNISANKKNIIKPIESEQQP